MTPSRLIPLLEPTRYGRRRSARTLGGPPATTTTTKMGRASPAIHGLIEDRRCTSRYGVVCAGRSLRAYGSLGALHLDLDAPVGLQALHQFRRGACAVAVAHHRLVLAHADRAHLGPVDAALHQQVAYGVGPRLR